MSLCLCLLFAQSEIAKALHIIRIRISFYCLILQLAQEQQRAMTVPVTSIIWGDEIIAENPLPSTFSLVFLYFLEKNHLRRRDTV